MRCVWSYFFLKGRKTNHEIKCKQNDSFVGTNKTKDKEASVFVWFILYIMVHMTTTSSVHRLIRVNTSSQFLQISWSPLHWVHSYYLYSIDVKRGGKGERRTYRVCIWRRNLFPVIQK